MKQNENQPVMQPEGGMKRSLIFFTLDCALSLGYC